MRTPAIVLWMVAPLIMAQSCNPTAPTEVVDSAADTTSHNFTWQIDTVGAEGLLRDAVILNDTCIYAVGRIRVRNASGQVDFETPYCLAQWDGQQWTPRKLRYFDPLVSGGNPYVVLPEGYSVLAWSPTNIWIVAGGVYKWNGTDTLMQPFDDFFYNPVGLRKLWGTSPTNVYGVGGNGSIVRYDGTFWRKVESGTTVPLTDIYGTPDGSVIRACGFDSRDGHTVLLECRNGAAWKILYDFYSYRPPPSCGSWCGFLNSTVGSLWTSGKREFMVAGGYVYRHLISHPDSVLQELVPIGGGINGIRVFDAYASHVRGSADNNVAVCGYGGDIYHWNGASWQGYNLRTSEDQYFGIAVSENKIIAVGKRYTSIFGVPLIVRGRR